MIKFLKTLWQYISGFFSMKADSLQNQKYVVSEKYDKIIQDNQTRLSDMSNAIAQLMTIEQNDILKIKSSNENIVNLKKSRDKHIENAKKLVEKLKLENKTKEEIESNSEYKVLIEHYSSTDQLIKQLEVSIGSLEDGLEVKRSQLSTLKNELQKLRNEQNNLRSEKLDTLSDITVSKQLQEVNDLITGITDRPQYDLEEVREARKVAKNRLALSSELANPNRMSEVINTDEFNSIIGLN